MRLARLALLGSACQLGVHGEDGPSDEIGVVGEQDNTAEKFHRCELFLLPPLPSPRFSALPAGAAAAGVNFWASN